jgi:dTDP-4-dehydrorhamnose 3,5-epimerase
MNRFRIQSKPLTGLQVITRQVLGDHRGFLSRLFCADELEQVGWTKPIAQINHTYTSKKGTVRGGHFQHPPHAEMKLVICIRGEVWDVAEHLRSSLAFTN